VHGSHELTCSRGAVAARLFIHKAKQAPLAAEEAAPRGTNYYDVRCTNCGRRPPAPRGDAPPGFGAGASLILQTQVVPHVKTAANDTIN